MEHLSGLGHRRFGIVMGWDEPSATPTRRRPTALLRRRASGSPAGATGSRPPGSTAAAPSPAAPATAARPAASPAASCSTGPSRRPRVLAFSDLLALGVIGRGRRARRRPSRPASVIGFDDVAAAAAATALTTVHQPHHEKGAAAARLLLDPDATRLGPPPRRARSSAPAPLPLPMKVPMLLTGSARSTPSARSTRLARGGAAHPSSAASRRCTACSRLRRLRHAAARARPRRRRARDPARRDRGDARAEPRRNSTAVPPAAQARGRWERLWLAEHRGAALPPIRRIAGRRRLTPCSTTTTACRRPRPRRRRPSTRSSTGSQKASGAPANPRRRAGCTFYHELAAAGGDARREAGGRAARTPHCRRRASRSPRPRGRRRRGLAGRPVAPVIVIPGSDPACARRRGEPDRQPGRQARLELAAEVVGDEPVGRAVDHHHTHDAGGLDVVGAADDGPDG